MESLPSWPSYIPNTPLRYPVILVNRFQHINFGDTQIPTTANVERLFLCLLIIYFLLPTSRSRLSFYCCESFLCILDTKIYDLQFFPYYSIDNVFWYAKVLNFDIKFIGFFPTVTCVIDAILKCLLNLKSLRFISVFFYDP